MKYVNIFSQLFSVGFYFIWIITFVIRLIINLFDVIQVSGTIENTGQSLVFRVDKESKYVLNITEGPLTYRYQFQEFYIHFGTDNNLGSEHKIQGYSFPAEVSIYVTIFSSNIPWLNNT